MSRVPASSIDIQWSANSEDASEVTGSLEYGSTLEALLADNTVFAPIPAKMAIMPSPPMHAAVIAPRDWNWYPSVAPKPIIMMTNKNSIIMAPV